MTNAWRGAAPAGRRVLSANTGLAYLALGLSSAVIGPALPWWSQHWQVSLDATGVLITGLFVASCVAIVVAGTLLDRIGRKPILMAGLGLLGTGLGVLAAAGSLPVATLATAIMGLGWGCLEASLNVFVADLFPAARGPALNLMNLFYGVGALAAPVAVGAALGANLAPGGVVAVLGATALLSGLFYVPLRFPTPPALTAHPAGTRGVALGVLRDRFVLTLALLFFVYVGLEVSVGGWASSLALAGPHLDASSAAFVTAAYWIAFTAARLGASVLSRTVAGARLVLGGALLAAGGTTAIALLPGLPAALFAGAVLAGVGFAPIFPTAFAQAADRYPGTAGIVSSVIVLGGSLGGAVFPYAIGWVLAHAGVPAAAGTLAGLCLVVAALQLALGHSDFSIHRNGAKDAKNDRPSMV